MRIHETVAHKRILIVEDDIAICKMLKTLLEIEGHSVRTAANGKEGIAALKAQDLPDVILLDMMMPHVSGWGFLDVLRGDPATASIPVIVVSAYDEIARSVNPDAFIPKPVELKSLLRAIEETAA
jgi:CheY-like chemotaxis protein